MQKILVIDDDESLRDTIGVMLERENFIPILASDGKSGLDKALTLNPQLLLVDLRLPGMSGVELISALHRTAIKCRSVGGFRRALGPRRNQG